MDCPALNSCVTIPFFCPPYSRTTRYICMLRWISEVTLLKAINLSWSCFSFQSYLLLLLHSHMNILADAGQKEGRWERRLCGTSHCRKTCLWGQQLPPTVILQWVLPLHWAVSHQKWCGEEWGTLCKQPPPAPGCPLTNLIILLSFNCMTKHTRYSINQVNNISFCLSEAGGSVLL